MRVIKATYDGKQVILPATMPGMPPGEVIVVFESNDDSLTDDWHRAQLEEFAKTWDSKDDAIYDSI
jgi:hypothetical protein